MPIENYVVGDVIGKGSYGEVTLASNKKDKKKVYFYFFGWLNFFNHCNKNVVIFDQLKIFSSFNFIIYSIIMYYINMCMFLNC